MKKVFYSLIFMLLLFTFNVKADTCYIGEGNYGNVSTCLLNSLTTGTVKNGTTGSITYNATNNTITFNNYKGSGIILDNFTNDLNIIFIGNNTINSHEVIYANTSNSGIDINIIGEENSTLTLTDDTDSYIDSTNGVNLLHIENMHIIVNDTKVYHVIYSSANLTEVIDCYFDNTMGAGDVIYVTYGDLKVDNCTIISNDCNYVIKADRSLELRNTNITANNVSTSVVETAQNSKSSNPELENGVIIENCDFDCINVSYHIFRIDYVHEALIKNVNVDLNNEITYSNSSFLNAANSICQRIIRMENVNFNSNKIGYILNLHGSNNNCITYVKNSSFNVENVTINPIYTSYVSLDMEKSSMIIQESFSYIYLYGSSCHNCFKDTVLDINFFLKYSGYSFELSTGSVDIIDSIFIFNNTSNMNTYGLYLNGSDNEDHITNSTILCKGFYYAVYISSDTIVENSNIVGTNMNGGTGSVYGFYSFYAVDINNSSIFIDSSNHNGYTNYGLYLGYDRPSEIDNTKINININSNLKTNNEYGVYLSKGGNLNNSYVKVKNLYNATPTYTSVLKYGLYSAGDTLIDGSYLDIYTDESIGTAIYNYKGSSDLHGLYFENDNFVLLTPNTGFYKDTYNSTYLYESKYINDPTLIHNTSLDSYHKLLYGRRNS